MEGPQDSLSLAQLLPRFVEFHRVLSFGGVLQISGVYVLKTSNRLEARLRKINAEILDLSNTMTKLFNNCLLGETVQDTWERKA